MKPVKTGILGFGRIGEGHHFKQMQESELFEVTSVCDVTESRRALAVENGLQATADLDEFLGWNLELVVIANHSSAHHDAALKVAAAGKHMLIEKPLCMTVAEANAMIEAARTHKVTLTVYHNRHFDDDYRRVKHLVNQGAIGDLIWLENRTFGLAPAVGFGTPDYNQKWRITKAAGGGTLMDFGPHWIEQILDLRAGHKVVTVFADVRHVKWGDTDDLFDVTMVFDDGVRAHAGKSDITFHKIPGKWIVMGTEGTIVAGHPGSGDLTLYRDQTEEHPEDSLEAQSLHDNLARHLRTGEPLIISADHALRVMQVIEAANQSAAAGASVATTI